MNTYNELKILYGAYFGVRLISYRTKEYIMRDIKKLIDEYIERNNMYYYEEVIKDAKEQSDITNLQDLLGVLKRIDAPMEVPLLVKEKIRELKEAK